MVKSGKRKKCLKQSNYRLIEEGEVYEGGEVETLTVDFTGIYTALEDNLFCSTLI